MPSACAFQDMKGIDFGIAAALSIACASAASAQTTSAVVARSAARPDFSASLGWFNANKGELSAHDNWYNRALHGAATFGWHWSTHLKTELEASAADALKIRVSGVRFPLWPLQLAHHTPPNCT